MNIIKKEKNGIVYVAIRSQMGSMQTPEFEKTVQDIIKTDKKRLLFDLGALAYLKSSDLRVILNAVKKIDQKSGKVVLCALNGYVKEMFEVNCFQAPIEIADTVESGLKTLSNILNAA